MNSTAYDNVICRSQNVKTYGSSSSFSEGSSSSVRLLIMVAVAQFVHPSFEVALLVYLFPHSYCVII